MAESSAANLALKKELKKTMPKPFEIIHDVYEVKEGDTPQTAKVNRTSGTYFSCYPHCDNRLVGNYAWATEEVCRITGLDNISVIVYPGTMAKVYGLERIVAIYGKAIFLPGKIYESCPNKNGYREVVARANAILSLLSVKRLSENKGWAEPKEVVEMAREIFGDDCASEVKMHYEFL